MYVYIYIYLLLGALGEVTRVVTETQIAEAKALAAKKEEEDDDFELTDAEPFVPVSFGARGISYILEFLFIHIFYY
jgi:hypothetical protein